MRVNRVLTGLMVWMAVSVPAALWAGKVLKARREELERQAQRDRQGKTELERRVQRGLPDPVGLQGLAGNQL